LSTWTFISIALIATACHRDPPPAAPKETAPLASSSGTPIGYLVDAAAQLQLRDDQLVMLRRIDLGLASDLRTIDERSREASRAAKSEPPTSTSGRMGPGGMRGMRGAPGPTGRGRSGQPTSTRRSSVGNQLLDARAAIVHDAIRRAFAVLDDAQRAPAKKVLEDHDVDLDVDHPGIPEDNSVDSTAR
jgi:hypothetical protein